MLGKTHFTMGMVAALLVAHPETVPGVFAAVAAGGIAGKLPDIDQDKGTVDREEVYDTIIDSLFIGAIIGIDCFMGNGICRYISDNWGPAIWLGMAGFLGLLAVGIISKHRAFTHSIASALLFSAAVFFICRPIVIPFIAGYASHIILDIFNKKGIQIFWPVKRRFCLKKCDAGGKANNILYWIGFGLTVIIGALLLVRALFYGNAETEWIHRLTSNKLWGLNALQLYLIFINIVTFLGFQRSWHHADREILAETDKSVRIQLEFETWFLDFLVFIGGGVGMFLSLIIHLAFPCGYNGNWWAICYASVLLWFTVYCYVSNPFNVSIGSVEWLTRNHLLLLAYIVVVNIVSGLLFWKNRKKHLNEFNPLHTLLWIMGALGGTIGAYPVVISCHRDHSYNYAVFGFPIMLVSQVLLVAYLLVSGLI